MTVCLYQYCKHIRTPRAVYIVLNRHTVDCLEYHNDVAINIENRRKKF